MSIYVILALYFIENCNCGYFPPSRGRGYYEQEPEPYYRQEPEPYNRQEPEPYNRQEPEPYYNSNQLKNIQEKNLRNNIDNNLNDYITRTNANRKYANVQDFAQSGNMDEDSRNILLALGILDYDYDYDGNYGYYKKK